MSGRARLLLFFVALVGLGIFSAFYLRTVRRPASIPDPEEHYVTFDSSKLGLEEPAQAEAQPTNPGEPPLLMLVGADGARFSLRLPATPDGALQIRPGDSEVGPREVRPFSAEEEQIFALILRIAQRDRGPEIQRFRSFLRDRYQSGLIRNYYRDTPAWSLDLGEVTRAQVRLARDAYSMLFVDREGRSFNACVMPQPTGLEIHLGAETPTKTTWLARVGTREAAALYGLLIRQDQEESTPEIRTLLRLLDLAYWEHHRGT